MPQESGLMERAELESLHSAATPQLRESLALKTHVLEGSLVSMAAGLPSSAILINRTTGLGMDVPATRETIQEIVAKYREAGIKRFFVQRHPDARPPDMVDWLLEAGLEKVRGWQTFERGTDPAPIVETGLSIRQIGREQGTAFARIACEAFDLGDAAVPWLAALVGREGWHFFMSFCGDEPAGTGALLIKDGCGWTTFGATTPKFRQRGSQAALLAARINHALELDVRKLYTCTGEDVPGDPQHSYRNIVKAGFREHCLKENYAPPKE